MEKNLSERLFQEFSRLVYQQCGINLHEGKKALLQARLNKRLRATGFSSYEEYYDYLCSNAHSDELVHFLDCISTNLTYFFREPQHFEHLEHVLIPELLERKRRERNSRIRIWSAGCSTGEEPYSLAMCILDQLDDVRKWDFRILASDISTRVLEIAASGVYSWEKVQKVPAALLSAYFEKNGAGSEASYAASSLLKRIVAFRRVNLKEAYPFKGPFDFIFCRNVMIYFDKQTQEELIRRFASYLSDGGHLFVGHSESLTGLNHSLKYVRPAVYRK
ncbi:MAG: protein-glutamate O-methyltransferase CheR [Syntrophobacteraceae bacterium]|jgi:chemotaxis protein methyltransferase CheR